MQETRTLDIISYDCGWGCGDYGTEDGPAAAGLDKLTAILRDQNYNIILSDLKLRNLGNRADFSHKHDTFAVTVKSVSDLAHRVYQDCKNHVFPVVIGGDHTSAIGTWSGITAAKEIEEDFGIIWIDAHMDAHTPETSEQGKWGGWWHGMPVACLTGNGKAEFTELINNNIKINPEHIVLIGIRSFEPGEENYIKNHNIKCYMADEVKNRGFDTIYTEALEYIKTNCRGYGISLDLDGLDPDDAPGVGTPEKNGISARQAETMLKGAIQDPDFHGIEIVEYNPHNDQNGKTAEVLRNIALAVFENETE